MKYDVLEPFREYLDVKFTPNTSKKYYSCVKKLFCNIQFNDVKEVPEEFIREEIVKFRTKNEFSAAKNSLMQLKEYYPDLKLPDNNFFKDVSMHKRNWSKKPKKIINYDTVRRKVNQIKNEKLKLAYRLAMISGLRVSELAALEKKDIRIVDGIICIHIRNGKGGNSYHIKCQEDKYLLKKLPEYINNLNTDRLFYSESYLREKADDLGLECHDFRRIFAILRRNKLKKEMPVAKANKIVQEELRHKRFSTTKRYLFNRKLIVKERKKKK